MADMYDTTVASMKIGVAVPIKNPSFRYWDDPGTWAAPTGWTAALLTAARNWAGYDADNAELALSGSTIPDDTTFNIKSGGLRFWNDNQPLNTSVKFYFSFSASVLFSGGGANKKIAFQLMVDDNAALSSPAYKGLTEIITNTTIHTLFTGAATATSMIGQDHAGFFIYLRDASGIVSTVDCIGIMFNPFAWTTLGYLALTNVWAVNGPQWRYGRETRLTKTPLGTSKSFDPSGGHESIQLAIELRNESMDTYENLKYFFDINKGSPGLPGLPLLLEPNLPGLPPTIMVNFADADFPLTKDSTRATRWGGTINFETVW